MLCDVVVYPEFDFANDNSREAFLGPVLNDYGSWVLWILGTAFEPEQTQLAIVTEPLVPNLTN